MHLIKNIMENTASASYDRALELHAVISGGIG